MHEKGPKKFGNSSKQPKIKRSGRNVHQRFNSVIQEAISSQTGFHTR